MSDTRIANARAQAEYAPGLSPADLTDPVLLALSGRRVSESAVRAFLGWPPRSRPPRRRAGQQQPKPQYPRLTAFQQLKGGTYYPDQVTDTPKKRARDSKNVLTRLERLAACAPKGLKLYTLDLPELDGRDLYHPDTVRTARKAAQTWLYARRLHGEWKLERGLCGGTHLHIVTCASAAQSGTAVYDLDGLAEYLVKPADARACLPKLGDRRGPAERRADHDAAAEDYLRAVAALAAGEYGDRDRLPRMGSPA